MKKWSLVLLVVLVVVVVDTAYGQGCSQCKLVAEQSSDMLNEDDFGSNINYGILYLMAIPYLLIMFLFRNRIINFFKGKKTD